MTKIVEVGPGHSEIAYVSTRNSSSGIQYVHTLLMRLHRHCTLEPVSESEFKVNADTSTREWYHQRILLVL